MASHGSVQLIIADKRDDAIGAERIGERIARDGDRCLRGDFVQTPIGQIRSNRAYR